MSDNKDIDRISNIINRLSELSIESSVLTQELRTLNQDSGISRTRTRGGGTTPTFAHGLEVGDRVVIQNNYRQQKGTIGVVTKIGRSQVVLTDSNGNEYKRKHSNLRTID